MRIIALATLLATTPTLAHAAKLSLGQGVLDDLPTVGATDRYTVYLRKGQDYAVEYIASDDSRATWNLRSPSGAVLSTWETSEDESYGFEFRAPATGTYRIEGRAVAIEGGKVSYFLRVAKDCRAKLPTACYINVGATQSRWADYGYDIDYVRLAGLKAMQLYTLLSSTTEPGKVDPTIQLVDERGTVLSEGDNITFRLPTTTLFVRFRQDNDSGGGPYKLTLR